ncbi:hypothetical protein JTE90_003569 [Oedothorax gibbosus]|uniref:BTB domain-containing protein n=1 Tax=Oedothorax gibbosus TaxID=931172 RepID=A0AAV6VJ89_9ARAC|nr:hypothetical protein JTE90_003569 [Oedothorax gibbosus]
MSKLNKEEILQYSKPDITIVVGEKDFKLHKQVLIKESKYFSELLKMCANNKQYAFHMNKDVSKEAFEILMIFIYRGTWNCNTKKLGHFSISPYIWALMEPLPRPMNLFPGRKDYQTFS